MNRRQLGARRDRERTARRQRARDPLEVVAVAARIDDHDDPAVVLAADQPTHHLFEVEQHHAERALLERVAARVAHARLAPAAQLGRHLEGQLLDHHRLERAAGHVDSLPERARAEQHAAAARAPEPVD